MTKQTKTNNLKYLIDPTFSKFNRLFVLSFFKLLYTKHIDCDFNVLIEGKSFFDVLAKKKYKAKKK